MQIKLNGKAREVEEGVSVQRLLDGLGLLALRVAVQVNEDIIKRDRYPETILKADDTVEILTFMSGG